METGERWREGLAELATVAPAPPGPCVLGVGNRLRGDDGAGPLLCDRLARGFGGVTIDAGIAPENHLERVVAAARGLVLVVDATDLGISPGEIRILAPGALVAAGVSTHACSPRLLVDYLEARRARPPVVRLIAIQPAGTEAISAAVAGSVTRLAEFLRELWPLEAREGEG